MQQQPLSVLTLVGWDGGTRLEDWIDTGYGGLAISYPSVLIF